MLHRRIQFVASEIYPMAKTGGLADVAASLPAAVAALGSDVHLVMPGYEEALDRAEGLVTSAMLPDVLGIGGGRVLTGRTPDSGLPLSLVDLPGLFRDGGGLYCHADGTDRPNNPLRFTALSHVATALALGGLGAPWKADAVHCNDWHTGLVPLLLRLAGGAARPASIYTVHNMAFQGLCPLDSLPLLGLPTSPEILNGLEFYGQASFLKAGLWFADRITTVSPNYAREIQTPEFGFGLEGVVASRADRLVGILNGIDTSLWNPSGSPLIPAHYSSRDVGGKAHCKMDVQKAMNLAVDPEAPLMVFIGRLTWQKMADVLLHTVPDMLAREPDRQFVLLGQGDKPLEQGFQDLARHFPGRVSIQIGYSEGLAHRLHAAGDILIHGSRFEPCGLTQLYAMRYGTVPVVRPVGGLADTVVDASDDALDGGTATGFHFAEASREAKLAAVNRAVSLYRRPEIWHRLRRAGMDTDFGWQRSARGYMAVYEGACARPAEQTIRP